MVVVTILPRCAINCIEVLEGYVLHKMIGRSENVATAPCKRIDSSPNLVDRLLQGASNAAVLNIESTVKNDLRAKLPLQLDGVHTCRSWLQRVEDIHTNIDKLWDEFPDRAATMKPDLRVRSHSPHFPENPRIWPFEELSVKTSRHQRSVLHTMIA